MLFPKVHIILSPIVEPKAHTTNSKKSDNSMGCIHCLTYFATNITIASAGCSPIIFKYLDKLILRGVLPNKISLSV